MTFENIMTENRDNAGIIILNRPEKLNAMNNSLSEDIDTAITGFEADNDVKAVIITGAGEKAFSAGFDIREITVLTDAELKNRGVRSTERTWHLATCQKPIIGAINGLAYGGGALLSTLFDLRVGCERTSFRFLGAQYGRINSTWTLPLIVGTPVAKELLFTARVVDAQEAYNIGLLNRLVPSADLMGAALEMVKLIAGNDDRVVRGIKDIINRDIGMAFVERYDNERNTVAASVRPPHPSESFAGFLKRKEQK
jgi:2-(1,2-epoxy-1,2-dihydrophenyl)acetyl-CoA isomerase